MPTVLMMTLPAMVQTINTCKDVVYLLKASKEESERL